MMAFVRFSTMSISKRAVTALMRDLEKLRTRKQTLTKDLAQVQREEAAILQVVSLSETNIKGLESKNHEIAKPKLGWNQHIRTVLEKAPTGMKVADIAKVLTQQGIRAIGKTPLRVLLWSESARMVRAGVLTKGEDGRYILVKKK
jgi:hypothetical protein